MANMYGGGGQGGGFYGALNPEQQAMMLQNFPDLLTQEEELERQLAESSALRIKAPTERMDWASQAARAFQGINAGHIRGQANAASKKLGESRAETAYLLAAAGKPKPKMYGPGDIRPPRAREDDYLNDPGP